MRLNRTRRTIVVLELEFIEFQRCHWNQYACLLHSGQAISDKVTGSHNAHVRYTQCGAHCSRLYSFSSKFVSCMLDLCAPAYWIHAYVNTHTTYACHLIDTMIERANGGTAKKSDGRDRENWVESVLWWERWAKETETIKSILTHTVRYTENRRNAMSEWSVVAGTWAAPRSHRGNLSALRISDHHVNRRT